MRIVVVVNKWWECEAVLAAMLNTNAFPPALSNGTVIAPWYDTRSSPRSQATDAHNATSRATFSYKQGTDLIFSVEVWSVSDLLEKQINPAAAARRQHACRQNYSTGRLRRQTW
jgi:hypothetical protein